MTHLSNRCFQKSGRGDTFPPFWWSPNCILFSMCPGFLWLVWNKFHISEYMTKSHTCGVVSLEHISHILSTSASVFLACNNWEAWVMGSNAVSAPDSCNLLSRNHCSKWLKLYLKTHKLSYTNIQNYTVQVLQYMTRHT